MSENEDHVSWSICGSIQAKLELHTSSFLNFCCQMLILALWFFAAHFQLDWKGSQILTEKIFRRKIEGNKKKNGMWRQCVFWLWPRKYFEPRPEFDRFHKRHNRWHFQRVRKKRKNHQIHGNGGCYNQRCRGSFVIPIPSPSQKDSLASPNRQKYIPSADFFELNPDFYFKNAQ